MLLYWCRFKVLCHFCFLQFKWLLWHHTFSGHHKSPLKEPSVEETFWRRYFCSGISEKYCWFLHQLFWWFKQIIYVFFSFSSSIKYLFEPIGCKILAHHIFQQQFYENDGCVIRGTINTFENKVPLQAFSSFTIFYAFQILVWTILRLGRSTHDCNI